MSMINSKKEQQRKQKVELGPIAVQLNEVVYHHQSKSNNQSSFEFGPFTLDVFNKELLVLLGPSGSGKTTLLRLIAGLQSPSKGDIKINGELVSGAGLNVRPENRGVGMVFQDNALFPHLTVRENILFGIQSWSSAEKERRLVELEDLLGLRDLTARYPFQLSGGQQQRVALARTLAPKPSVILLDEPLSDLDGELRSQLANELRDIIKTLGITVVWVTHDLSEALNLAERAVVLNDGKIEQIDNPWELYHRPKTRFVADFVGKAEFIQGKVKERMILTEVGCFTNTKHFKEGEHIELMVRPEYVQILPHDGGLGTIVKRQFRGSRHLYTILLASGQTLLSHQPSTMILPEGAKVRVSLDIKEIIAFPIQ